MRERAADFRSLKFRSNDLLSCANQGLVFHFIFNHYIFDQCGHQIII